MLSLLSIKVNYRMTTTLDLESGRLIITLKERSGSPVVFAPGLRPHVRPSVPLEEFDQLLRRGMKPDCFYVSEYFTFSLTDVGVQVKATHGPSFCVVPQKEWDDFVRKYKLLR